MFKKLLSTVLVAAMAVSLVACGGGSSSSGGSASSSGSAAESSDGGSGSDLGAGETWKISTVHNPGSVGVRALEAFKESVEANSGVTVEIYDSSVLGDWTATLDMMRSNDIQFVVFNPVSFETDVPILAMLNNYYSFDSLDHLHKFFEGEGGDYVMNSWNEIGLQGHALYSLGFRELYNSKTPINSMDDLKGLKIRGYSTVQTAAWQAVGVDPVSIDWSELFVSLQQKLIDGEEGAIVNCEDYSFYEVTDYFTMTDHVMGCDMLLSTADWYNGLSPELKEVCDNASKASYEYHRDHYISENEELLKKFADEYGMDVAELPADVKAEMAEKMSAVTKEAILKITGEEIFNTYMDYVDAAR